MLQENLSHIKLGNKTVHRQDSSPTRILETVHRHFWRQFTGHIWRQFTDTFFFYKNVNEYRYIVLYINCKNIGMPKSYIYNFQLNPAFPSFQVKLGYTLDTFTRVYMDL